MTIYEIASSESVPEVVPAEIDDPRCFYSVFMVAI